MQKFYEKVSFKQEINKENQAIYCFYLDDKIIKTPMRHILSTISEEKAKKIVLEWQDQQDIIDPQTMPMTKFLNNVHDKIIPDRQNIIHHLANYMHNDTICFLTDHIQSDLYKQQVEHWIPIIQFFEKKLNTPINYGNSLVIPNQSNIYTEYFKALLYALDPEDFAGLYAVISSLGSHMLAFYAYWGHLSYEKVFALANLEQDYNIKQWGLDTETEQEKFRSCEAFFEAVSFLHTTRMNN